MDAGSKEDIVDLQVQKREKVFQVSDFSCIRIKKMSKSLYEDPEATNSHI